MLRVIILGAAAGGGLPQWNCGCFNCVAARDGRLRKATQTSLAVTSDDDHWALINAAPEVREQIGATARLQPKSGLRHSPIQSVILTNAEVDAVAGLLSLREGSPFSIYATAQVHDVLKANAIFDVLRPNVVTRESITADTSFTLSGLDITPFAVAGKEALYLEGAGTDDGATLGLTLKGQMSGRIVHIVTACAAIDDALCARLDGADAIFFDGTLWRDDELIAQGLGQKTGQRMGHVAMDGPDGAIARLANVKAGRKVFIHINNSNPVWQASAERAQAERAGWEIGFDGMEIVL
jgi:pyrroloquinoline quinone biosynthesis protein B